MEEYKGFGIINDNYSCKQVKALGRGSVNKCLRGNYTSDSEVKRAIDNFINSRKTKKGNTKNDTKENADRGN